jgi:hypothetical protein
LDYQPCPRRSHQNCSCLTWSPITRANVDRSADFPSACVQQFQLFLIGAGILDRNVQSEIKIRWSK